MAIAWDNAVDGINNGGAGALSFNLTFGSLTNAFAVVPIMRLFTADISTVTVDGNAAVDLLGGPVVISSGNQFGYLYGVPLGTISGSKAIVVSATTNQFILAGASSYSGVAQSNIIDGVPSTISQLSANSQTLSVTSTIDNSWGILAGFKAFDGLFGDAGTGSTKRAFDNAFGEWYIFDSNAPFTPAGSHSMTWTAPLIQMMAGMVAIKPAGAAPPPPSSGDDSPASLYLSKYKLPNKYR